MPHDYKTKENITDVTKAYWIRTIPADHCSNFVEGGKPDERQGILSYSDIQAIPTTARLAKMNTTCRDEPFGKLRPWLNWTIPAPNKNEVDELLRGNKSNFEVGTEIPKNGKPIESDRFHRWTMKDEPMFLNFSDPTILKLEADPASFTDEKAVVNYTSYTNESWVYMIITGMYENKTHRRDTDRTFIPSAHPVSSKKRSTMLAPPPPPPFSLFFVSPKPNPWAAQIRCIFTVTTSLSSSNPIENSARKSSPPNSIIPPAATLSYCLTVASSPSHSKPIIQAPGPFTAISHGMLPPVSPSKFWRGQLRHRPYWRPTRHGLERLTKLVPTGKNGTQTQTTILILAIPFRMIRGCK